jgi:tetratricopeptide (TPR) repeat protein
MALVYAGRAWIAAGDLRRAVTALEQAVGVAQATGDKEPAVEGRSTLARAQLELGHPQAGLAAVSAALELEYPIEAPTLRLLEGVALLELDRIDESLRAFTDAVTAADGLLALADHNVAASRARALALSGLAAATADPTRAAAAMEAFAWADTVTTAAGIVAESRRLLDAIAAHDHAGVLAEVRSNQTQSG